MTNEKTRKDTLMWKIMDEHKILAELSPNHDLLRYCTPLEEEGMLEWSQQYRNEFYNKFGPQKQKKNGYEVMKGFLTQKKEKPMTGRDLRTNYHNALRAATNSFNGIK